MRLLTPGKPHLTYCTNVHPGEAWADVRAALLGPVAEVARRVCPGRPFGVGLRLGASAARELREPRAREELRDALRMAGAYVFTVNAFPFGDFHGTTVKERVYRPDWAERARLAYTNDVADLLAAILPEGMTGSISTVPGGDARRASSAAARQAIAERLLDSAAYLVSVERGSGKALTLALEPEPACLLETAADAAAFFRAHLFSRDAVARFAARIGEPAAAAERALRRHLGVCLDACHVAVGFEPAAEALRVLAGEGISIAKLQVSVGLEVEGADAAREVLPALDDGVYLHQTTVATTDGATHRYRDLGDALADGKEGIWRVHAHVPVDRDPFRPLGTTRTHLEALLAAVREREITPHLEVETYTWTVLPEHLRGSDLTDDITRELDWTLCTLAPRA
jgi:hypothetical protein